MRITNKLYYKNTDQLSCLAKVVKISSDGIELDQTISYPEGGGQESDHGFISLVRNPKIRLQFNDT